MEALAADAWQAQFAMWQRLTEIDGYKWTGNHEAVRVGINALRVRLEQAEKERDGASFLRDAAEAKWRRLERDVITAEARERALREVLEAMLPGQLGSEYEYLNNALYHACVEIARRALDAAPS